MSAQRIAVALVLTLLVAGCATQKVQPWQKGKLARRDMALDGDPLKRRFAAHVYFSKEAASGGQGVGGGGCGCN